MKYTRNRHDNVYADKRISTTVFLKQTQKASKIVMLPFHVQLF